MDGRSWEKQIFGKMPAEAPINERLWSLVLELSAQLTANKQQVDSLRKQIEDLEGQAVHAKSGYALRRFNVDLSQEVFTSQLERMNAQLVNENTALAYESRQLASLLRESESTLETIMSKFRAFCHAAQQHGLDLSAYYEARLETQAHKIDAMMLRDQDSMQTISDRLGGLVRDALQSMDSEGTWNSDDPKTDTLEGATELERLRYDNEILRSLLALREDDDTDGRDLDRVNAGDLSVSRFPLDHPAQANLPKPSTGRAGVAEEVSESDKTNSTIKSGSYEVQENEAHSSNAADRAPPVAVENANPGSDEGTTNDRGDMNPLENPSIDELVPGKAFIDQVDAGIPATST